MLPLLSKETCVLCVPRLSDTQSWLNSIFYVFSVNWHKCLVVKKSKKKMVSEDASSLKLSALVTDREVGWWRADIRKQVTRSLCVRGGKSILFKICQQSKFDTSCSSRRVEKSQNKCGKWWWNSLFLMMNPYRLVTLSPSQCVTTRRFFKILLPLSS